MLFYPFAMLPLLSWAVLLLLAAVSLRGGDHLDARLIRAAKLAGYDCEIKFDVLLYEHYVRCGAYTLRVRNISDVAHRRWEFQFTDRPAVF